MKRIIFAIVLLCSVSLKAQENIKFEETLTWNQIKEKAKKENTYIFVDAFTTWCVPCKEMAAKIFPQAKIANFYNKNFINVAIQIDKTKADNTYVKAWYKDAEEIKSTYQVNQFPSYLYFNPTGDLVYKIVGASTDGDEFLEKTKLALDPKSQYATLKQQYNTGRRDTGFLSSLIQAAIISSDIVALPEFINPYLKAQLNILTKQNITYIFYGTQTTNDFGFDVLRQHPAQIDSIIGTGFSRKTVTRLIFNENVFPSLKTNAKIKNYGGGMVDYQGELNKNVDWDNINDIIGKKYPRHLDEVNRFSKTLYYQWAENWPKYAEIVAEYTKKSKDEINIDEITDYIETIFQFCNNSKVLQNAENWSEIALKSDGNDKIRYRVINSRLMYKNGKKMQAISEMESIVLSLGQKSGQLVDEIVKMKNGEKTWY